MKVILYFLAVISGSTTSITERFNTEAECEKYAASLIRDLEKEFTIAYNPKYVHSCRGKQ